MRVLGRVEDSSRSVCRWVLNVESSGVEHESSRKLVGSKTRSDLEIGGERREMWTYIYEISPGGDLVEGQTSESKNRRWGESPGV